MYWYRLQFTSHRVYFTQLKFFLYFFIPVSIITISFPFVLEDEKKSLGIYTLLLFSHSPSGALVKWKNDCKINKEIYP